MKKDFTYFGFFLFGGFVVFMLGLVVLATMQKVELTSEQYYEEELNFQSWKNKVARTALANKSIILEKENGQPVLKFFSNKILETKSINGKVFFYKPNSKAQDFNLDFKTDTGSLKIDPANLVPGNYSVKVEWTTAKIPFKEGFAAEIFFQF